LDTDLAMNVKSEVIRGMEHGIALEKEPALEPDHGAVLESEHLQHRAIALENELSQVGVVHFRLLQPRRNWRWAEYQAAKLQCQAGRQQVLDLLERILHMPPSWIEMQRTCP